jgi:diadenosine tetraphosphatase ApaH/serine/threonine PP2A family protein phosphatase
MVLALLSDVHANLEALEACLKHARESGATRFAFLGDLVGYGADAGAVVSVVMRHAQEGALVVKGNHDDAIARGAPYMNDAVRESIAWAHEQLTPEQRDFLAALPLSRRDGQSFYVHASAASPQRWTYIDSPAAALRSMRAAEAIYTFGGHVHEQVLFAEVEAGAKEHRPVSASAISVASHRRWLALVGSVGQPRDGRPAAGYALFDEPRARITFYRLPYDHDAAAAKIRNAGLSAALAYRVARGV